MVDGSVHVNSGYAAPAPEQTRTIKRRIRTIEAVAGGSSPSAEVILNTLSEKIGILDISGRIVDCNQAWREGDGSSPFFGEPFSIGTDYLELCTCSSHPVGERIASAIVEIAFGTQGTNSIEYSYETGTQTRSFELTIRRLIEGCSSYILLEHRDISERRIAEEDRRRFLSLTSDLLIIADLEGVFCWVNGAWERTLGWRRDEMIGRKWSDFIHSDDLAVRAVSRNDGRDEACTFVTRCRTKAGDYRWISWHGRSYDAEGLWYAAAIDITGRREGEQILLQSERDFRQLADAMPQIVWAADSDGNIQYVNGQWAELTGLQIESSLGSGWIEAVYSEDRERVTTSWRHALGCGDPWEAEFRLRCTHGALRWHLSRSHPIRDEHGRIVRWFGACTDIHDRRRVEEQCKQNQERYELAALTGRVGIWELDLRSGELCLASNLLEMLGYDSDELQGGLEEWKALVHPQDRQYGDETLQAHLVGKSVNYEVELRRRHKDGSYRWFLVRGIAIRDEEGVPIRIVGADTDISDRKAADRALRERDELLRAVVQSTPECVQMVDVDGMLLYMNEAGLSMVEVSQQEILDGISYIQLVAPEFREEWSRHHAQVCGGEDASWEFEIITGNNQRRWIETHGTALRAGGKHAVHLAVTRDITERRAIEGARDAILEAERIARSTAERTNRLKDDFLCTLSHELRTPLNAILGWSRILSDKAADAALVSEGMEIIRRNAKSQAQLIDNLLDMSTLLSDEMQLTVAPLSISKVLMEALEPLFPAARSKGLSVQFDSATDFIVRGDEDRLRQVFTQIFGNALKFTSEGGTLRITIEVSESTGTISISDSGIGIPKEFLPYIFDRFSQADASTTRCFGGLGLGLSLAKHIVTLHGGSVSAASEGPGTGTTITVTLSRE